MNEIIKIIKLPVIHSDVDKHLFHLYTHQFIKNKFEFFDNIQTNIFLSSSQKNMITEYFCMIQKIFNTMIRLKYIWKFNKAKIYNTDDLYMNPIKLNEKNTIVLLQNNTKYIFHIRELISTINTSLSNSSHFFTEPNVCKNPYTNLPFDKSSLYNIYFFIKQSTFIMPTLLHKYFLSDFDLYYFSVSNEQLINDEYLRTYVDNNCLYNIRIIVKQMLLDHKIRQIHIHNEFPKDILLTIMKPYLKLYYISNYSLNKYNKFCSFKILHKKLNEFVKYNSNFGRKKMHFIQLKPFSKSKKIKYYFDSKHPKFFDITKNSSYIDIFINSHLSKKNNYTSNMFMPGFTMDNSDDSDDDSVVNDENIQENENNIDDTDDGSNDGSLPIYNENMVTQAYYYPNHDEEIENNSDDDTIIEGDDYDEDNHYDNHDEHEMNTVD